MPITPLPTAPSRKQSPSAFAENADAFLSQLPTFAAEATTLEQTVNAAEVVVIAAESSAVSAKNAAQAAQAAAEAAAYAAAWAVDEPYTVGQCVFGTDGQTYRAMAASTGVNPVGDATGKWVQISMAWNTLSAWGRVFVNSADAGAARTTLELGTAATRDVGTDSGNVMEVGAFGLGARGRTLPEGADLNDYVTNGFYGVDTITTAQTILNSPVGTAFGLTVLPVGAYGSTSAFQILKPFNTQFIWTRFATNGVWSAWVELHHTGNIRSTTGNSTEYPMTQKAVTDALAQFAHLSMTGSITLNGTTNNTVVMTDIVTELELEIGDAIRIDTGSYNKLHTVESITDNSSIIVNYEHAGNRGDGSLRLPDFTGQATVTRIAKWFNAPIGVGQAWQNVKGSRAVETTYTNTTGRSVQVNISTRLEGDGAAEVSLTVGGVLVARSVTRYTAREKVSFVSAIVPAGATYVASNSNGSLYIWAELR